MHAVCLNLRFFPDDFVWPFDERFDGKTAANGRRAETEAAPRRLPYLCTRLPRSGVALIFQNYNYENFFNSLDRRNDFAHIVDIL